MGGFKMAGEDLSSCIHFIIYCAEVFQMTEAKDISH